ncbi:hypothetical protein DERF_009299 [Dermatophagoides farinae]|uniref:Uncharacterized protein n=1 Tax=Dermatophagoides farinae TaxID=6954 RepID=A0A922HWM7_DERFA|nr:uncharacterized protein LOC124495010 [Dermatophagoides farinae]KAH7637036.1 hypothetical protein HUG17_7242 [Dermatophagoides farinae]KAH9510793.1 hypothetical protein DERF_009299 [Dermatophagoides farinae]
MFTTFLISLIPTTTSNPLSNSKNKHSLMLKPLTILWFIIPSLIIIASSSSAALSRMNSEVITSNSGIGVSDMLLISNLSCYVCTTIDDINCKYLNETINRLHRQQQQEMGGNTGSGEHSMIGYDNDQSGYSNHDHHHNPNHDHYTLESILSADSSSYDLLATASSSSEDQSLLPTNNGGHMDPNLMNEFRADCSPSEQYCVVIRLGVSAPDNVQEFNFFALKRGCAEQCTDGCFIIGNGEKTKLSICASCCRSNYCNLGNSATAFNHHHTGQWFLTIIIISLLLLMIRII